MSRIRKPADGLHDLLFVIGIALFMLGLSAVAAGVRGDDAAETAIPATGLGVSRSSPLPLPPSIVCSGCPCDRQITIARVASPAEPCRTEGDGLEGSVRPRRAIDGGTTDVTGLRQAQSRTDDPRQFLQHMANRMRSRDVIGLQSCGRPCG